MATLSKPFGFKTHSLIPEIKISNVPCKRLGVKILFKEGVTMRIDTL